MLQKRPCPARRTSHAGQHRLRGACYIIRCRYLSHSEGGTAQPRHLSKDNYLNAHTVIIYFRIRGSLALRSASRRDLVGGSSAPRVSGTKTAAGSARPAAIASASCALWTSSFPKLISNPRSVLRMQSPEPKPRADAMQYRNGEKNCASDQKSPRPLREAGIQVLEPCGGCYDENHCRHFNLRGYLGLSSAAFEASLSARVGRASGRR